MSQQKFNKFATCQSTRIDLHTYKCTLPIHHFLPKPNILLSESCVTKIHSPSPFTPSNKHPNNTTPTMKLSILVVVALAAVASVAAVGTWKQTSFSASVAMGVSFESDKMGYIAGGINGQGPAVWASTDAGKTWSQAETQQATMFMAVGTNVRKFTQSQTCPPLDAPSLTRTPNPAPPLLVAPRLSRATATTGC